MADSPYFFILILMTNTELSHKEFVLFSLLRTALNGEPFTQIMDAGAWRSIYVEAKRQSLLGIIWKVANSLPREQQPPMEVALMWVSESEAIRGFNELQNKEAARLTKLFAEVGRKTIILKGQANARLYPDKFSRQPGDIDIWVEGGRKSVLQLLREFGLASDNEKLKASYHHVDLPPNENGIEVEVHFRPSSGNYNPLTNRRLQKWLEKEVLSSTMSEEHFNVPSLRFALVMQLSHIQRHLLENGIGLRQICDYFLLLKSSTIKERKEVSSLLKKFGLHPIAGALMWVLREVFHLKENLALCTPDNYRGKWMLKEVIEGGNFGHYAKEERMGLWQRFFATRKRRMKLLRFDFWEVLWMDIFYWESIIAKTPERIKYRTLSLKYVR